MPNLMWMRLMENLRCFGVLIAGAVIVHNELKVIQEEQQIAVWTLWVSVLESPTVRRTAVIMIDLSHLSEEEQEMIMTVLKRDAELKKAEEERVK